MSAAYYRLKKYRQKQSVEIEDEVQTEALPSRCDVPKCEQNQLVNSNLYLEVPIDKTPSI